jgi:hypothetical protein
MQEKYDELRKKHPVFTYDRYEIRNLEDRVEILYHFSIGEFASFSPKWTLPRNRITFFDETDKVIRELVFNLGMVELISYWKIACPPRIIVKAGALDEYRVNWWKKQYFLGLGEFFHTNGIRADFDSFMSLESGEAGNSRDGLESTTGGESTAGGEPAAAVIDACGPAHSLEGFLIPIGGGKDSAVSLELLEAYRDTNLCYIINPRGATLQTAEAAGYPEEKVIGVHRTLDARMLALNREGYLNGHTPFSALVAFSSVLLAYLNNRKYVALSNESSANESNVEGTEINHQYSKSFQFERDFCEYEKRYIGSGVQYFSILRPFSELQIARNFARHPKYYKVFKSCNAGSKEDKWCCSCPKCLFVYLILSPYIERPILKDIFGEDLLENEKLAGILEELIGIRPEKPFECVGTRDEINTAICLTIKKDERLGRPCPRLLEHYKGLSVYRKYRNRENPYDRYFDENHLIPAELIGQVKETMLS